MNKRLFDILFSLGVILLFAGPIFVISVLIKLTSKGPVLFWSQRVGRYNQIFMMPKFRTMVMDSPLVATHLLEESLDHFTPIGKILRRTSLDELPQVWSILVGDMSVIGPRPALFNQYDLIEMRTSKNVHTLLPGLSGLAQINGRDDLTLKDKVNFDAQYVKTQNFCLDMMIIVKTIYVVLSRRGIRQ
jgi:O-antigen biosynthesis protein WbqP